MGAEFPKFDLNCFKGQWPVTLKGMDIFERANKHLNIGVSVFPYDTEFEDGNLQIKGGFIFFKGSVY